MINPFTIYGVSNQQNPSQCNPLALSYVAQTQGSGSDTLDLTNAYSGGQIDRIQGVYIDASDCTSAVTLKCGISGHRVTIQAGMQGFIPLLAPNPPTFVITCASASPNARFFFLNVAMPAGVWTA